VLKLNARIKSLQSELERLLGQASKQGFAAKESQYLEVHPEPSHSLTITSQMNAKIIKDLTEKVDAAEVTSGGSACNWGWARTHVHL
jgi:hypothetical protein